MKIISHVRLLSDRALFLFKNLNHVIQSVTNKKFDYLLTDSEVIEMLSFAASSQNPLVIRERENFIRELPPKDWDTLEEEYGDGFLDQFLPVCE